MKNYLQVGILAVVITSIGVIPLHNHAFGQAVPSDVFIAGFCDATFTPGFLSYGPVEPGDESGEFLLTITNGGTATAVSYEVEGTGWIAGADYFGPVPILTGDPIMDVGVTHYEVGLPVGSPYATKTLLTGAPVSIGGPIPIGGFIDTTWQMSVVFLPGIPEFVGPSTQTITVTGVC